MEQAVLERELLHPDIHASRNNEIVAGPLNHRESVSMKFTAIINKEGRLYVSWCPELDIASQGRTVEKALDNLREAIELYLEDEDATVPEKTPFFTFVEVAHAKAARPSRA